MDNKLDGNAAAGTLQAIFSFEMTEAKVTCANCGDSNRIGETVAYMNGMGTIIRCPSCDHALIRLSHVRGRSFLDLQGARVLQLRVNE